jgi:hypothetical protein
LQHGLPAFIPIHLSGLIGVRASVVKDDTFQATKSANGSICMAVLQGYSDLRHQPDGAFVRSFVQAFTAACSEDRVNDQVRCSRISFMCCVGVSF